ncbi:MAG: S41 family peptidase [Acidobacteriota bacterium]
MLSCRCRRAVPGIALLIGLMVASGAIAQSSPSLLEEANAAYESKDFRRAGELFERSALTTRNPGEAYNAACSYALAKLPEEAFGQLERAVRFGFMDADWMRQDGDLATLREDRRWAPLAEKASALAARQADFWQGPASEVPFREDLSLDDKLAGLATLWAEVKFNFVNFDLVPEVDWDALYRESLPRVRQSRSTVEYYRILTRLMARLRDGHSNVYPPAELRDEFWGRPLVATAWIEQQVIVTKVEEPDLGVGVGDRVVSIDGQPAADYARRRVEPMQSASTDQDLASRTFGRGLLAGPAGSTVTLAVRNAEGELRQVELTRRPLAEQAVMRPSHRPFELSWLDGDIAHVRLNGFGTPAAADGFAAAFDELSSAKALILDVRENGGGNSSEGWRVLSHLTAEALPVASWYTRQYRPAHRAWGRGPSTFGREGGVRRLTGPGPYTGPVAVLIGPRTFSAAEDFALTFDLLDRGLLIGEATGGSTGQPVSFTLPGGGSARVCAKRDLYPDGREFVGVGILPDRVVAPTVADFRAGRDTVLEAAVEALQTPG